MADLTIYFIRNSKGQYRNGSKWAKTPKIWTNRGHALSSLVSGLKTYDSGTGYRYELPEDDWELITVDISDTISKSDSCLEIVKKKNKQADLAKELGKAFAALVEKIELEEETQWEWAICVGGYSEKMAGKRLSDWLKSQKLKKDKDYRVAKRDPYYAVAFADKNIATMARLVLDGSVKSIDLTNYVEIEFDNQ